MNQTQFLNAICNDVQAGCQELEKIYADKKFFPSVACAQAAIETGQNGVYGTNTIFTVAHNLFGIKCQLNDGWTGKTMDFRTWETVIRLPNETDQQLEARARKQYSYTQITSVLIYPKANAKVFIIDKFRAYDSIKDSIIDRGRFLVRNTNYAKAGVFIAKNYKEQAEALERGHYATGEKYSEIIISIIETHKLYLMDKE